MSINSTLVDKVEVFSVTSSIGFVYNCTWLFSGLVALVLVVSGVLIRRGLSPIPIQHTWYKKLFCQGNLKWYHWKAWYGFLFTFHSNYGRIFIAVSTQYTDVTNPSYHMNARAALCTHRLQSRDNNGKDEVSAICQCQCQSSIYIAHHRECL